MSCHFIPLQQKNPELQNPGSQFPMNLQKQKTFKNHQDLACFSNIT